MTQFIFLGI